MRIPLSILSVPRVSKNKTRRPLHPRAPRPLVVERLEERALLDADLGILAFPDPHLEATDGAADLVVSEIQSRPFAVAGQPFPFSFWIRNDGSAPAQAVRTDRVLLSTDAVLSPEDIQVSFEFRYGHDLAPGTREPGFQFLELPAETAPGAYFLIVQADVFDEESESDESNNTLAYAITVPEFAPDLVVTAAQAPASAVVGDTITVTWTVANQGTGAAPPSLMSDGVYFSLDEVFDNSDVFLNGAYSGDALPLAVGGTYTRSAQVTLPIVTAGHYYLLARADAFTDQSELDEANNVRAVAIEVIGRNLLVTGAEAPTTVLGGSSAHVTWTVRYDSSAPLGQGFTDWVYLSNDNVLDDGDAFVGFYERVGPLAPGQSYAAAVDTFPLEFAPGAYYFLVAIDRWNQIPESDENDNVVALPVTVRGVDLAVTALSAPDSAILGDSIAVQWELTNAGTEPVEIPDYAQFYLSTDAIWDEGDTDLYAVFDFDAGTLDPGASVTAGGNLDLGVGSTSDQYLIVVVDGYNAADVNLANNVFVRPITLSAPDIRGDTISAPTAASVNQSITIDWSATNDSAVAAPERWTDLVVLSTDTTLDYFSDRQLGYGSPPTAPLAPGASYSARLTAELPNVAPGTYYILVQVAFQGQPDVDPTNNFLVHEITIGAPDLVVTEATAPTSAVLGQSFAISYTVLNQGDTPAGSGRWVDAIYLSTDAILNEVTDTSLSAANIFNTSPLPVGGTYSRTVNVTLRFLPNLSTGDRYLIVVTNRDAVVHQGETDTTNNTLVLPIALFAPDLIVTAIDAPAALETGTPANISWTVANPTDYAAVQGWSDTIYLSEDAVYDTSDRFLGSAGRSGLAPQGEYTLSRSITIPGNVTAGDKFLIVRTDGSLDQPEANETNNTFAVPVRIGHPDYNLVMTAASAPAALIVGENVDFSFTVQNVGTDPIGANWTDTLYLSTTAELTPGTFFRLADYTPNAGAFFLQPGDSYTRAASVRIPNGLAASNGYYLIWETDSGQAKLETNETDNRYLLPVSVAGADIVVSSFSAPATAAVGATIEVSWTLTNQGTVATTVPWTDRFELGGQFVANVPLVTGLPLAPGASHTFAANLVVPNVLGGSSGGDYALVLRANPYAQQFETNVNNNMASLPIHVVPPAADLRVDTFEAPTEAELGATIPLRWTVTNAGSADAVADWTDVVYLSANPYFDASARPVHIERIAAQTPLAGGEGYTIEADVTLLSDFAAGQAYLVVRTDSGNEQAETDKTNNSRAVPFTLLATDLAISDLVAPSGAGQGAYASVSWTVTNTGAHAAHGDWVDQVYLSLDLIVDDTDELLGSFARTEPLAAGAHYTQSVFVPILSERTGPLYLLVKTDGAANLTETAENNNVIGQAFEVGGVDLGTSAVSAPSAITLGESFEVSWTVTNLGVNATSTDYWDIVYLSADDQVSADDVFLAQRQRTGPLAARDSYTASALVSLPTNRALAAGNYRILVRTDYLEQQIETNEGNNVGSTAGISLVIPPLPDLVVAGIEAPVEGFSGQSFDLAWTVTNLGTASAPGAWIEQVALWTGPDSNSGTEAALIGAFLVGGGGDLDPGQSLRRIQRIEFPELAGDYWLVVRTDHANLVGEGPGETNNRTFSATPLRLRPPPRPDLTISSLTPPVDGIVAGQNVSVSFIVTNHGTASTQVPVWTDVAFLSQNPNLTGATAGLGTLPVAVATNVSYLAPGDSYLQSVSLELPVTAFGTWYLYAYANAAKVGNVLIPGSAMPDADNADNLVRSNPFSITQAPPADLRVTAVIAPAQAFSGQPAPLAWTVTNDGEAPTRANSWTDRVYLSTDQTLDGGDTLVGAFVHDGALAVGESYTAGGDVTLPIGVTGEFYLFVVTDDLADVYEGDFDGNNVGRDSSATQIILTPPPDLETMLVTVPPVADASHALELNYRVANNGATDTPNSDWTDLIYLSSDDQFDPGADTPLTAARNFQPLAAGAFYDRTLSVYLPDEISGPYWLFVQADSGAQVFELDRGNNIGRSGRIEVRSNPADLVVSQFLVPAGAQAGGAIEITYTITNQGAGATARDFWTDRITLSTTPALGGEELLDSHVHIGALAPGASYTRTVLVTLPETVAGTQYLIVQTDVPNLSTPTDPSYLFNGPNGRVYEGAGEGNNTAARALAVAGPGADLIVTDASVLATLFASQTAQIGWTVRNQGGSPTSASVWYDDVYLSADSHIGNADDVYLGSRLRSSGLAASEEYFSLVDLKIPETVAAGSYHVIVRTDRPTPLNAADPNANRVAEANEANNTFVSGLVEVAIPPTPDLVITNVTAPESAYSGREIEISWTVTNSGPASASGSWVDVIYLSLDQILDPGADQAIAYRPVSGPLVAGDSYTAFARLSIPLGVTGSFYAFVVTDAGKQLFEGGEEANNTAYDPVSLAIDLAAPVDLVAGTLTVPATATPGVETAIVYTVQNNSTFAALGPWTDALYLSTDDEWDVGDLLFGKLKLTEDLAAGDSYTRIVTAPMPGINPGDYRVIIRSDILGNVPETNEVNNLAASIDHVAVDVPLLELGTPVTGTLNPGQSLFYRINTAESQTVRVSFDAANGNSHTDIFARKELLPTSGQFDFTTETPFAADQVLNISQPDRGTYYLLVRSTPGTNEATTFSLFAETRPFGIDSIDRSSADRGGTITLQIDGSELFAIYALEATLENGAGTSIAASAIFYESPERIFATFDLRGASLGTYSLTLTGSSLEYVGSFEEQTFALVRTDYSDILADCFTVVEARPDDIEYTVYSTPAVRTDRIFDIVVTVANRGTHDVVAPVVTVSTDLDIVLESLVDGVSRTGVLSFVAAGTEGPGGILRPGQSSVVRLIAHAPSIETTIVVTAGPLTDDGTPVDWDGLIESYGGDPAAEPWSTINAALIDKYGTTWTSYGLGLAQQATELSAIDGRIATVTALIEDTMFTLMASLSEQASSPPEPSLLATTGSSATPPAGEGANLQHNGALLQPTTGPLEALERWAAVQALAWQNDGLTTAMFHQRAWYLPLGPGGGTPSEKIWEDGSVASKRAEATTYGKVLFSKVHKNYRDEIEAELKDRAKHDRGNKKPIHKKPGTLNFLTGTKGLKLKGDASAYSEHGDLEFAFGAMTGGSGYVDKIDFKDVDECNVHYEGVIHYEWTDDFNYNFGDIFAETSAILEANGWASSVHTGLRIEKKVEGNVKKNNDPDCEPDKKPEKGKKTTTIVSRPKDPNDIVGPAGFGDEKWTNAKEPLEYMIRFENQASATGPAQQIVITTQLDPDLDYRTFRLGEFGWSGARYAGPTNQPFLNQRIDLTEELGFLVDVQAAIDVRTGLATWTLTSIDPTTGEVPRDASKGLLPPNVADGIGEGFVRFTVKAKSGLATGTKIDALATIVFDTEAPLDTPIWTNTLDVDGPSSAVQTLAPETEDSTFTVRWSGADAASGSGLAGYSVYVSTDGGVYVPWLTNTSLEEAPFAGEEGHTYAFYSIAHDNAGNSEAAPAVADAVTQVAQNLPPAASLAATSLSGTATGALLRFTLDAFDNSASDRAAGFTFTLDWDDGLGPQTVSGPSGTTIEREVSSGAHVVSLAATDRHGATSEISRNVVFVGTPHDDVLWAISHGDRVSLIGFRFGGPTFVPRTVSGINGMVMMFGLGGDDLLVGDLVRPQKLYLEGEAGADLLVGGEDADVLDGGAGDDILIGGGGDDQLRGGADRDILAAGAGADSLSGGVGQDILVAAPTVFDTDAAAVGALLTDWTSPEDYSARVERLSGSPAAPPPAAQYILQPGVTVLDDDSIDHLFGDDDPDWFLADLGEDLLEDLAADEVALDL